jgi:hypothetical protein
LGGNIAKRDTLTHEIRQLSQNGYRTRSAKSPHAMDLAAKGCQHLYLNLKTATKP